MGAILEDEVLGVITGDKIRIGRNQGVSAVSALAGDTISDELPGTRRPRG